MKIIYSIFVVVVIFGLFSSEMKAQDKGAGNRVGGIRMGYHSSQFASDGGFSPSFKVAERITTDGDTAKPTDAQKAEWFDIPFFLGAGVKIWFVSIEARYHWGIMEVTDGYKSQSFQLGAGISL